MKSIFSIIVFVSDDRQTEKNTNVSITAHTNIEERGFVIGTLHASQLLRYMRITLNKPIYYQASFEQA